MKWIANRSLPFMAALFFSCSANAATVVEYYNPDLDNYFITSDPGEQSMVDTGAMGRWQRTGDTFVAGGSNQVCRFYGSTLGPNSHFYTADSDECAYLKSIYNPAAKSWKFESNDFAITTATDAGCPTGTAPVYRAYNNGSSRGVDSNHRITASYAAIQQVVAKGWSYEGVVMCSGLPIYKTSYENKNSISLDNPTTPPHWEIPGVQLESGEYGWYGRHIGFADFTQEGAYSAIVFSDSYKDVYPGSNPLKVPDSPSKIYFLRKDTATGKWNDVTSNLIKNANERYVCITPSFVEIADLNNDQKPDVFISCTGTDFQINGQFTDAEHSDQFIVLSQADGSYKVSKLPIGKIYGHQAALADINNDGNVDILTVDPYVNRTPFILWGNGDGTFQQDLTRFPSDMYGKLIYGIQAIPINGKINVFVSADAPGSYSNLAGDWLGYGLKVLQYKNGYFQYVQDLTNGIPKVTNTGLQYGLALDVIYHKGSYYTYQVTPDYANEAIIKINPSTGVGTILAENMRQGKEGGNIFKITSQNVLVAQHSDCGQNSRNPTDWSYNICNFRLQLEVGD